MPLFLCAQDITGHWRGVLKVQSFQLHIVFNVTKTGDIYSSTMDSPDQGVSGIPVTTVTFRDSLLIIKVSNARIEYKGKLIAPNRIEGMFYQSGQTLKLNLARDDGKSDLIKRPQEPIPPFSYYSENVKIKKNDFTISGTLTLPSKDGVYPLVILISGSGKQDRDGQVFGHKPFLVLSDYLTKSGMAVFRFDDRETGESTGDFESATTLDFAEDVDSILNYLKSRKEINKSQIGLIGHSEGGMIAPLVSVKSHDIKFIILLAAPGIPGKNLLLLQQESIGKASGIREDELKNSRLINSGAYDIIINGIDSDSIKNALRKYFKKIVKSQENSAKLSEVEIDELIEKQVSILSNPWLQFFIKYDPGKVLSQVKCPVLALNGKMDLQVPSNINLQAIRSNLEKGGNKKIIIRELPNLNHLFQECETGLPVEYNLIEQTFSPLVLEEISQWILLLVK